MEKERDMFKEDLNDTTSGGGKEELIKKAWSVRDEAVKKKNDAQVELARERIGVMQVNHASQTWPTRQKHLFVQYIAPATSLLLQLSLAFLRKRRPSSTSFLYIRYYTRYVCCCTVGSASAA